MATINCIIGAVVNVLFMLLMSKCRVAPNEVLAIKNKHINGVATPKAIANILYIGFFDRIATITEVVIKSGLNASNSPILPNVINRFIRLYIMSD